MSVSEPSIPDPSTPDPAVPETDVPVTVAPDPSVLETVVRCRELDPMVAFLVGLGLRVHTISPADDPAEVTLLGWGARVVVQRHEVDVAAVLRMRLADLPAGAEPVEIVAPNGALVVEQVSASIDVVVPPIRPEVSIVRSSGGDAFGVGRAGMGYRDLLPSRWGGRFIASHIRIAEGGDVADYVHFHRIRFQMIFVAAGWVDVVYEDQGEPFRMVAGDCVLQPPEIRHRVLRSSAGLEVIEIGCPARHDTVAEPVITLPTAPLRPDRDFGGQRFVRHVAAGAPVTTSIVPGWTVRDTGIGDATGGLAGARVLRADGSGADPVVLTHSGEFAMSVVLAGSASLVVDGRPAERLGSRDAVAFPASTEWSWTDWTDDFELLDVTLPSDTVATVRHD